MDTAVVKELNKNSLRSRLTQRREATIQELAEPTGLSVVTVKALLNEMIAQGEVIEGETAPSGGGRPSRRYVYNGEYRHAAAVYGYQNENKNSIHVLVVNLFGECVYKDQAFIEDIRVESFCGMLDRAMGAYPKIAAIAFGLPGFEENGVIVANDYGGIVGDRFLRFYQSRYGLPIRYINDVNAAVVGYSGPAHVKTCLAGIYFPRLYRPGAGMVINGGVYTGAQHFAGEIGHLLPDTDWLLLDYDDEEAVSDAVARMLGIYCCVVAPEQFILYGDFFSEKSAGEIRCRTQDLLCGQFQVNVEVSSAFERDFERGMTALALRQLGDTFI